MRQTTKLIPATLLPVVVAIAVYGWGVRGAAARGGSASAAGTMEAAAKTVPAGAGSAGATAAAARDPRLKGAYRFDENGWIYVHLEGSPEDIGFQHGYLLAPEIADALKGIELEDVHDTHHTWAFFRSAAENMLWPRVPAEYQAELKGIVAGLHARGEKNIDLWDVVVLNAFQELPGYYVPWYDAHHKKATAAHMTSPGNCSAFIATGAWTKNHQIVIAHNAWTNYIDGERWRIMFDIEPTHGYRILMDGFPGVITSDDDFGMNSDGIMITETTISQFNGWEPNGIPEFARSREALQYADSIASYVKILNKGNNGGYANDWLIGDRKTGEIARFEEGLKYTKLWTTKSGYYTSANFPSDPNVTKFETTFNPNDPETSPNARHKRWLELMKQYKGKIDARLAEQFESDTYDAYRKRQGPDQRSLCGRNDYSAHGVKIWGWGPYYPGGTIQAKVTDSAMAGKMEMFAHMGPPCGKNFYAKPFLAAHPQYDWMKPVLRNMLLYPWTEFQSGEAAKH